MPGDCRRQTTWSDAFFLPKNKMLSVRSFFPLRILLPIGIVLSGRTRWRTRNAGVSELIRSLRPSR